MSDVEKQIERWRESLAGSELLGRAEIHELESHLREEMEHVQAAGLSADEAFLIARRRLGDAAALAQEFAKVSPHRRLTGRLSWMALGILVYYLALHASIFLSNATVVLSYVVGLRHPWLSIFACVLHVAVFVATGALLWRYLARHAASRASTARAPISLPLGLFVAATVVGLSFFSMFSHTLAYRFVPTPGMSQIALAQGWVSSSWFLLMPFLLVGLIALVAWRGRDPASAP